ncbi:MAG TPA: 16S rRNA (guanine(527)-N(7))-methyltransferase RsmG [Rhizomicrobium sp.]|jgi:16S rRNA (guanine527-N7)-methyltransferase|nr:16S rRNA (guanine(527)-N(7))-methyltransferase RsmG [Rhizomicrobium sp.]
MTGAGFGPEEFQQASNVSRETLDRLTLFVALLEDWNSRHNLVSAASLREIWRRHIWDSAQLVDVVSPGAASLVDLGSGAGFPGLILALLLRDRTGFRTLLYEATRKKADFLTAAAERLAVMPEIRNARIEEARPEPFDLVTARACAPLPRLLLYAQAFQGEGTVNLFLKGQSVGSELTEAHKIWKMQVQERPSRSDPSGKILIIEQLQPKAGRQA